jgi:hypothetical protein
MVIHIVNGFEGEKPDFLQLIGKTEQFCGLVLARENQIMTVPARASGPDCARERDQERWCPITPGCSAHIRTRVIRGIGVAEINISTDKDVPVIRTPRRENECAQDQNLKTG